MQLLQRPDLIAPSVARAPMASTIACAPVIVVTQGTLYLQSRTPNCLLVKV